MGDYDYEVTTDGFCWADSFYCDCLLQPQRRCNERKTQGVGAIRYGEPPRRSLGRRWRDWQRRPRLECPKSQCRSAAAGTVVRESAVRGRGNGKIRQGVSASVMVNADHSVM